MASPRAASTQSIVTPPHPAVAPPGERARGEVIVLRRREETSRINALAVHRGEDAWAALDDPRLLLEWAELERTCPWSTPFQSSAFTRTWLRHYQERYAPVLVTMRAQDGKLLALLVLGACRRTRRLVVAGAHQAEYQAWLARPEASREFIVRTLRALDSLLPGSDLSFKYLPRGLPLEELAASPLFRARARLTAFRRPLMRLSATEIAESLRKKSNKSRWSRLQRLGALEFRRIRDAAGLAVVFDEIIAAYDERQAAVNGVRPFAQDPVKRAFHLDLMRTAADLLHVTVTTLAGKVIAAHIGLLGRDAVHLAIVSHSEAHASHSPGKLHLLRLGQLLLEEGTAVLDLTPGGDPWKERFANAHDQVHLLTIHRSAASRQLRRLELSALRMLKTTARTMGISRSGARRIMGEFRRLV